jgi:hypothetical protein
VTLPKASFYRSIPSTNLYTFFTSILSVGLQSALSNAILTHSLSLRPPPPMLITVSDSDIATAHISVTLYVLYVQYFMYVLLHVQYLLL